MAIRKLIQQEIMNGWVISGACSVCAMRFKPKNPSATPREIHRELTASFNGYNCREDASQAAARILKKLPKKD
jgi:hypothetical protein